jgi:hypothetical protein
MSRASATGIPRGASAMVAMSVVRARIGSGWPRPGFPCRVLVPGGDRGQVGFSRQSAVSAVSFGAPAGFGPAHTAPEGNGVHGCDLPQSLDRRFDGSA